MSTINVYWSCIENEWLRAKPPIPLTKLFYEDKKGIESFEHTDMHKCPAFNRRFKNTFGLKSIYDYEFKSRNGEVSSDLYDQSFFERHVNIKSIDKKLFAFQQSYIFFTDEKSLPVSFSIPPYLHDNNIMERCID